MHRVDICSADFESNELQERERSFHAAAAANENEQSAKTLSRNPFSSSFERFDVPGIRTAELPL